MSSMDELDKIVTAISALKYTELRILAESLVDTFTDDNHKWSPKDGPEALMRVLADWSNGWEVDEPKSTDPVSS